jgi:hypothetical protein
MELVEVLLQNVVAQAVVVTIWRNVLEETMMTK